MHTSSLISSASMLVLALASPVGNSLGCSAMKQLIDHVRGDTPAEAYCSSFLKLSPSTNSTSTITTTSTVYAGTTSTSVMFKSGNPPSATVTPTSTSVAKRAVEPQIASSNIAVGCSCYIPTPAATRIAVVTKVSTTTMAPPVHTTTVYPCADPFQTRIPTLPYAAANNTLGIPTANNLYYISTTPEGASAQPCCNACFFGVENCVNAWWYFYQGCVVQQAAPNDAQGSGVGVSAQCPAGQLKGLEYVRDENPPFRSAGSIAGPCGVAYGDAI